MNNVKAPRFLNDVYRDLRDRHLLLPAVALLVALIAVPLVLRKPAEEPAVAPPPVAASADTTAVTSAVLVDNSVSVRDYEKRLAKLKSKNPFEQHFGVDQSDSAGGNGGGDTTSTGRVRQQCLGDDRV